MKFAQTEKDEHLIKLIITIGGCAMLANRENVPMTCKTVNDDEMFGIHFENFCAIGKKHNKHDCECADLKLCKLANELQFSNNTKLRWQHLSQCVAQKGFFMRYATD